MTPREGIGSVRIGSVLVEDVPLSAEDEAMMLLTGFAYRDPKDGILTLTETGNTWVSEWCQKRIEAHRDTR